MKQYINLIRVVKLVFIVTCLYVVMNNLLSVKVYADSYDFAVLNVNASDKFVQSVQNELDNLPQEVKSYITSNLKIFCYANSLDWGHGGVEDGMTRTSNKGNIEIYLKEDCVDLHRTFLHEIGHALDKTHKIQTGISFSSEELFQNCLNKNTGNFEKCLPYKAANMNTDSERYAEIFTAYIMNPAALKKRCPLLYTYMDLYFKDLSS